MSASRWRPAQQALLVVAAFVTGSTTVAAPAGGQTLVWSTGGRMQIGSGVEADIRVVFVKGEFRVTGEGGRYAAPQCVVPFDFSLAYSVYTVSARCTPYNVSATFRLSDRQQSGGRVGFTLSVAGEAIGDN